MRSAGTLALGAAVTVAALAFGSRPLGVAGVGLLLAAGLARAWAGLARGPVSAVVRADPSPAVEGDRVRLQVEARRRSWTPVGWWALEGSLGRLGRFECRLRGRGRAGTGAVELGRLPRGAYDVADVRAVLADHLGLAAVAVPADTRPTAVLVHPRLVELEGLFSDAGRLGANGRRLLLRRPAGFDLHSVREYEQGESLRRVHWPTTARRGRLMVKELEDTPRDAALVVLDCDPAGAVGTPPDSSFDAAARAAGSLVQAYVARGRSAQLATTGRSAAVLRVRPGQDMSGSHMSGGQTPGHVQGVQGALAVLAAAEPDALQPLAGWLRHARVGEAAGELVAVTCLLEPAAVEALVAVNARRLVSVVWIDAPSFAGRPT
ncbi:MAG TPA: DUF58 domain-containing protein, partial [Gaiellaceae bacterium]|nr:DUF58 domain-containing protein [Gaiellaceae bacterium]